MGRLPRASLLAFLLSAVVLFLPTLGTLPRLEAKGAALILALGVLAVWALGTGSPLLRTPNRTASWAWALAGAHALSAVAAGCGEAAAFRVAGVAALAVALGWSSRCDEDGARLLLRTLAVLGALTGILVVIQRTPEDPGSGTFDHKGLAGAFLSIALPVCLALSARERKAWRVGALACLGAAATGLLLNETRAAWIAAAAGVLPVVLQRPKRLLLAAGVLAAGALAAGLVAGRIHADLLQRMRSIYLNREPRVLFWQASIRAWEESPWLGHGPGSFPRAVAPAAARLLTGTRIESYSTYAHADLLQTGVEAGWAGAAVLLALGLSAGLAALRGLRTGAPFASAAAGGLLAGAVNAALSFPLYDPGCSLALAVLAGIAAGPSGTEPRGHRRPVLAGLAALALLLSLRLPAQLRRLPMPGEERRQAGRAAFFLGDPKRGRRHLERAVLEAPWDPETRMELAHARFLSGDHPGAYEALARALRVFPYDSFPSWHLAWGTLLLREGRDLQGALNHLSYTEGNSPDPADRERAHTLSAACRRRMGDARMPP